MRYPTKPFCVLPLALDAFRDKVRDYQAWLINVAWHPWYTVDQSWQGVWGRLLRE